MYWHKATRQHFNCSSNPQKRVTICWNSEDCKIIKPDRKRRAHNKSCTYSSILERDPSKMEPIGPGQPGEQEGWLQIFTSLCLCTDTIPQSHHSSGADNQLCPLSPPSDSTCHPRPQLHHEFPRNPPAKPAREGVGQSRAVKQVGELQILILIFCLLSLPSLILSSVAD